jgi:hypothetical protein
MKWCDGRDVAGISLLEVLLALALFSMVVPGLWTVFARHQSSVGTMAERAEALEGLRILTWLIPLELDLGTSGEDWQASTDTVALRAFRGFGTIDSVGPTGVEAFVCFVGDRAPDPRKDSLLVLDGAGHWVAADLLDRRGLDVPCSGDGASGQEERWTLSQSARTGLVFRIFERGSYHLAGGALRYRRGMGGRQPVTSEFMGNGRFLPSQAGPPGLNWEVTLKVTAHRFPSMGHDSPARHWRGEG